MKPHNENHRFEDIPLIHDAMHDRHALMLVSLLVLIVGYPFVSRAQFGNFIFSLITSVVLFSGIFASIDDRKSFRRALMIGIPSLLLNWMQPFTSNQAVFLLSSLFNIFFFAFAIITLVNYIFRGKIVTNDKLYAALCAYLLVGIAFGFLYFLIESLAPSSFHFNGTPKGIDIAESIYFSFTTLTTSGYGDITPLSSLARSIAVVESVTGVFYMAVLITRLVSAYTTEEMKRGK